MILAPPARWSGPRPSQSAARSRPPRAEAPPLPATCCWPGSLLRSRPDQPSHGRGNASSRPFGNGRWGGAGRFNGLVSLISAGVTRRFAGHAVPPRHDWSQAVFGDRRIALDVAGGGPVNGATRKSQTFGARCRFMIGFQVSHAGGGCFVGLPTALPDNTHRLASETSRRGT